MVLDVSAAGAAGAALIALSMAIPAQAGGDATASPPKLEHVSVQLSWKNQFEFAGFYAALEKGFYSDAGLAVELREGDAGADPIDAVTSGLATYAVGSANVVAARMAGRSTVVLASYLRSPFLMLATRPEIHNPGDLRGHSVMVPQRDLVGTNYALMFKRFGMSAKDIAVVSPEYDLDAFLSGRVDAISVAVTDELFTLRSSGRPFALIDPGSFGADMPEYLLFTSETEAGSHPQRTERFVEATRHGWAYALAHSDEIIDLLITKYHSAKSRDALRFEADQLRHLMSPSMADIGAIDETTVRRAVNQLTELGYPSGAVNPASILFHATDRAQLGLTDAEVAWLNKHPRLRVHNETSWPPINFAENGQPRGYSIDYMNLLAHKLGVAVDYVTGPTWDQFMDLQRQGRLDVMLNIKETVERERTLAFTLPYLNLSTAIAARRDQPFTHIDQLNGHTVAAIKGFYMEDYLRRNYPDIKVITCEDEAACLSLVAFGEADATIDSLPPIDYTIRQKGLTNLAITGGVDDPDTRSELRIATTVENTILRDILAKAMVRVTDAEKAEIAGRWLGAARTGQAADAAASQALDVTQEEREWIAAHPVIRVGNESDWPPFDFAKDGQAMGASVDYIKILAARLGMRVEFVTGPAWSELLASAHDRKLDVLMNTVDTPEREDYLLFSRTYLPGFDLLVGRAGSPITSLRDVAPGRIAIIDGYAETTAFLHQFGHLKPVFEPTLDAALQAVADGRVDLAMANFGVAQYMIANNPAYHNLVVNGAVGGRDFQSESRFAVRSDWPQLAALLDKAMAAGPANEFARVVAKWVPDAPSGEQRQRLKLDEAEWADLDQRSSIAICVHPNAMPFEMVDTEGRLAGINADLMNAMSIRLALPFRLVETHSWADSLQRFARRDCDVLTMVTRDESGLGDAIVTQPLLSVPVAIAVRPDTTLSDSLDGFTNMRVGVVSGSNFVDWLQAWYPSNTLEHADDLPAALRMLRDKEVTAVVDTLPALAYRITTDGLTDVRIGAKLNEQWQEAMAVRSDEPLLASALNKAIATLSDADQASVVAHWTPARFDTGERRWWDAIATTFNAIGLGAMLALVLVLVWLRKLAVLNRQVKIERERATRLLDNAAQGFMSFGPDLAVLPGVSRACLETLGHDPVGKEVDAVLLPGKFDRQELFCAIAARIFAQTDAQRRAAMLSLLPAEIELGGKTLAVQYRWIGASIMVVLTDRTDEVDLTRRLEQEHKRIEMVAAAVRDGRDFADTVAGFRQFVAADTAHLAEMGQAGLYRAVHTFKGIFNQFGFDALPRALHELEDRLRGNGARSMPITAEEARALLNGTDWSALLDKELATIATYLGPDFMNKDGVVALSAAAARDYEAMARQLLAIGDVEDRWVLSVLEKMAQLRQVSLTAELSEYGHLVAQLADRLEKEIEPLTVEGDDIHVDHEIFAPFLRTLGHVFRNAVDHGIESPDERAAAGKSDAGRIHCTVALQGDDVRIEIIDDGAGIDIDLLRQTIGGPAQGLSERDLVMRIFDDGLSLRHEVSDFAGRGVGLAAVRAEVEKLRGQISVRSIKGAGTHFIFIVPLSSPLQSRRAA